MKCRKCGRWARSYLGLPREEPGGDLPLDVDLRERTFCYGRTVVLCSDCTNSADEAICSTFAWQEYLRHCHAVRLGNTEAVPSLLAASAQLRQLFDGWLGERKQETPNA